MTWENRKNFQSKRVGRIRFNRNGNYSTYSNNRSVYNNKDQSRQSSDLRMKKEFDFGTTRRFYDNKYKETNNDSTYKQLFRINSKIKYNKGEAPYNGLSFQSNLIETYRNYLIYTEDSLIYVWDTEKEDCSLIFAGHTSAVQKFSLGYSYTCISSSKNETLIWNIKSGRIERNLSGGRLVSMHPDQMKALVTSNISIDIYDIVKNRIVKSIIISNKYKLTELNWISDANKVIGGSEDSIIRIWNADTGLLEMILDGHRSKIKYIYIVPGGEECISISEDKEAKIWNLVNGRCIYTFNATDHDFDPIFVINHGSNCTEKKVECIEKLFKLIIDDAKCTLKKNGKIETIEGYPDEISSYCFLNS